MNHRVGNKCFDYIREDVLNQFLRTKYKNFAKIGDENYYIYY